MTVLTILTVAYAVVLVAALAVILTAILIYLWRIGHELQATAGWLDTVAERAAGLQPHLEGLRDPCFEAADDLVRAEQAVTRAVKKDPHDAEHQDAEHTVRL